MHVLYVDDDRVNAVLFAEFCRQVPGVTVATAFDGREALSTMSECQADLLVVDLHLPDTDGLALLPRLRAGSPRALPAYLCTADDCEQVAQAARAAGFAGCLSKPLQAEDVLAVLRDGADR